MAELLFREKNEKNITIHALIRGQIASETFLSHCDLEEIFMDRRTSESEKLEAIRNSWERVATELDDGHVYWGIFHRVIFRPSRPIKLHSLGFWGPQKETVGEYRVNVIVSKLSTLAVAKQKTTLITQFQVIVPVVRRRDIFFVHLDPPVHIAASGRWTQIEFTLKGPRTCRSQEMQFKCQGEGGVTFEFSNSSLQMPVIRYEIA